MLTSYLPFRSFSIRSPSLFGLNEGIYTDSFTVYSHFQVLFASLSFFTRFSFKFVIIHSFSVNFSRFQSIFGGSVWLLGPVLTSYPPFNPFFTLIGIKQGQLHRFCGYLFSFSCLIHPIKSLPCSVYFESLTINRFLD